MCMRASPWRGLPASVPWHRSARCQGVQVPGFLVGSGVWVWGAGGPCVDCHQLPVGGAGSGSSGSTTAGVAAAVELKRQAWQSSSPISMAHADSPSSVSSISLNCSSSDMMASSPVASVISHGRVSVAQELRCPALMRQNNEAVTRRSKCAGRG